MIILITILIMKYLPFPELSKEIYKYVVIKTCIGSTLITLISVLLKRRGGGCWRILLSSTKTSVVGSGSWTVLLAEFT